MLNIKPFQETLNKSYCGPAVLKMVLDFYGVDNGEAELAELLHCDPDLGVDEKSIKEVVYSLGFKVEVKNFSSFEDIKTWLEKGIPVIVDWFTRGRSDYPDSTVADGHYSVVVDLDEEYIYLQDPEIGGLRKISKEDFIRVWFDFRGDHIENWKEMIIRQIIAIYK